MISKTYKVIHWAGKEKLPAKAILGPLNDPGESFERQWYLIELTDEELVDLSNKYDVMIRGSFEINNGTKKNPKITKYDASIYLDDKGRMFRQR